MFRPDFSNGMESVAVLTCQQTQPISDCQHHYIKSHERYEICDDCNSASFKSIQSHVHCELLCIEIDVGGDGVREQIVKYHKFCYCATLYQKLTLRYELAKGQRDWWFACLREPRGLREVWSPVREPPWLQVCGGMASRGRRMRSLTDFTESVDEARREENLQENTKTSKGEWTGWVMQRDDDLARLRRLGAMWFESLWSYGGECNGNAARITSCRAGANQLDKGIAEMSHFLSSYHHERRNRHMFWIGRHKRTLYRGWFNHRLQIMEGVGSVRQKRSTRTAVW
jgi:hypothetical protein